MLRSAQKGVAYMKNIVKFITIILLIVSTSIANALEFYNNFCAPYYTGQIAVEVKVSLFDVIHHKALTIKARDSNIIWESKTFDLIYPKATYAVNAYTKLGLIGTVEQYNITTKKATLVVSACNWTSNSFINSKHTHNYECVLFYIKVYFTKIT